jgi:hypothetical protein
MHKYMAFFAGLLLASAAGAQDSQDLATRFGAREQIEQIDMSPSGQRVVYLMPGPGASTVAVVQSLGASEAQVIARTNGNPERLRWCSFVTEERLVCRFSVLVVNGDDIVPFNRLIAVNADGSEPQLLGERQSFFDAYIRQFDGTIIDWLPGEAGTVLMSRVYVPEVNRMNTRLVRHNEGLGVDRLDVRTLRSTSVEPANDHASSISRTVVATPDHGNRDVRGATGQLGSRTDYFYRTE